MPKYLRIVLDVIMQGIALLLVAFILLSVLVYAFKEKDYFALIWLILPLSLIYLYRRFRK